MRDVSTPPDGITDMVHRDLRTALALAARWGEMMARRRAEHARELALAEQQRRRELQERFEAHRAVMRTELAPVQQPPWWEAARPGDIAERYAQATQWAPVDDVARTTLERIQQEVKDRYGLDPQDYLRAQGLERYLRDEQEQEAGQQRQGPPRCSLSVAEDDSFEVRVNGTARSHRSMEQAIKHLAKAARAHGAPVTVTVHDPYTAGGGPTEVSVDGDGSVSSDRLQEMARQREERDAQRDHAEAARLAEAAAAGDVQNEADARHAAAEAEQLWDSGDRRAKLADRLIAAFGGSEAGRDGVQARMAADRDQGAPPAAAARATGRRPKARKNTGRGAGQERDLGLG